MMRAILRTAPVVGVLTLVLGATTGASAGGGGGCHVGATVAEGTTVAMVRNCFVGTVTFAPAGEPIAFVNRDRAPHTVTGAGWDGGEVEGLGRTEVSFPGEGVYAYTCVYHAGMSGALVIGDAAGPGASDGGVVQPDPAQTAEATPDPGSQSSTSPAPTLGVIAGLIGGGVGFGLGRRRR